MGALDGLDVQVAHSIVLTNSGIPRVGQWARALVAEAGHVVFISVSSGKRENRGSYVRVNQQRLFRYIEVESGLQKHA